MIRKPPPSSVIDPNHRLSKLIGGFWPFCEGSGTIARDISRGNHGTLTSISDPTKVAAFAMRPGIGAVVNFLSNAVNYQQEYISTPASVVYARQSHFSVEAYLRATGDSSGNFCQIPNFWAMAAGKGSNHAFVKSGVVGFDSGIAVPLNIWQHVMWTLDGSRRPTLYINGVLRYSSTNTSGWNSPSGALIIGSAAPGVYGYGGEIAWFRYWSACITPQMVADLYRDPFQMMYQRKRVFAATSTTPVATTIGGRWFRRGSTPQFIGALASRR